MRIVNLKISDNQTINVILRNVGYIEWRKDQKAVSMHFTTGGSVETRTYVFQNDDYFATAKSEMGM